jgi:glycine C-acetyltransferase
MFEGVRAPFESQLGEIRGAGRYKSERILASAHNARIDLPTENGVLNPCANN